MPAGRALIVSGAQLATEAEGQRVSPLLADPESWVHRFKGYAPVINTTDREKDYRQYYSRASRRIVEYAFEDELTRFGYRF
jgi:hypothetical protein